MKPYENRIKKLLKTTYFTKVRYLGSTRFVDGSFIRFDAEFFDKEGDCWDVPSEYCTSNIKAIMKYIIYLFVKNRVDVDTVVELP